MIRVWPLWAMVVLAGVACTSTPPAQDPVLSEGLQTELAGEAASKDSRAGSAGGEAAADSVADVATALQARLDTSLSKSRLSLAGVEAAYDSSRNHAANVFARLGQLRTVVEQAKLGEAALTELERLEVEAGLLNQHSEALLTDLRREQRGVADFGRRAGDALRPLLELDVVAAASAEGSAQHAVLRSLEGELQQFQTAVALGTQNALERRSDDLVSQVAGLVKRVEVVETALQSQLATKPSKTKTAGTLQGAAPATASGSPGKQAKALARAKLRSEAQDEVSAEAMGEIAEVSTNVGVLLLQFFPEVAPNHVQNFKRLVGQGFYNGLGFHRILPGYVAQGGCPQGNGLGGPGWQIDNEFNERRHRRGTLSMARFAHPDSAGSQFFICLDDRPELDGKQTVFGRVIRGEATLAAIEAAATDSGKPSKPIQIQQIVLRPWLQGDNEKSMIAGNPVR